MPTKLNTERSELIYLFKRMTNVTSMEVERNSGLIDTPGHKPELSTYTDLLAAYPDYLATEVIQKKLSLK